MAVSKMIIMVVIGLLGFLLILLIINFLTKGFFEGYGKSINLTNKSISDITVGAAPILTIYFLKKINKKRADSASFFIYIILAILVILAIYFIYTKLYGMSHSGAKQSVEILKNITENPRI